VIVGRHRLSDDPDGEVLLLEAGPPDSAMPGAGPRGRPRHPVAARSAAARRSTGWSTSAATAPTLTPGATSSAWGWGDDDLPPSFRRAEETLRPEPVRYVHPLCQAWLESASSTPR
jgi:hypothetical protein